LLDKIIDKLFPRSSSFLDPSFVLGLWERSGVVTKLDATVAQQQKEIQALTAGRKKPIPLWTLPKYS